MGKTCPNCDGAKQRWDSSQKMMKDCGVCGGTGMSPVPQSSALDAIIDMLNKSPYVIPSTLRLFFCYRERALDA